MLADKDTFIRNSAGNPELVFTFKEGDFRLVEVVKVGLPCHLWGWGRPEKTNLHQEGGSCEGPRTETKKCAENPCPKGAPQQLIDAAKKQIRSDTESYQSYTMMSANGNALKDTNYRIGNKYPLLASHARERRRFDLKLSRKDKKTLIQYDFRKAKAVWHHNEETFHPEKERTSVQDSLNLHIWRTLSKDNGVWACEVMLDPRTSLYTAVYTVAVENDIPDIEVKSGDSFSMPCNNVALTKFFHNTLVTEWYHNTSLYEKYEDSKPTEVPELTIKTSSPDDSGIWLCKVVEFNKKKKKIREWATNVVRALEFTITCERRERGRRQIWREERFGIKKFLRAKRKLQKLRKRNVQKEIPQRESQEKSPKSPEPSKKKEPPKKTRTC
ncbi:ig-like domain-containing protein [Caerostris extrusa]|uniref:Ig-like domain-containing protein n=1 Tax=Caerostris extrusa TaxID=172846 RepID=A0AAV4X958_CAEEX|nr:ig-like domain-containing protein [Caerostris extrusa]